MKIAFLIPSLTNSGGMERVMTQIITYISQNKSDELHLIMYGNCSGKIFFKLPDNVQICRPNFAYSANSKYSYAIKSMVFIRKSIKRVSPDTILSFGEIWNNFVLLALLGLKYPIFISDRCKPDKSFGKLHDSLRRFLYPKATGIIAQTQKAKEIYLRQFKHDNIAVIGNPIRKIAPTGVPKENVVVSVGRLITTKNFDQLIDIFSKINNPNWKLQIIGGDALKQTNSITLKEQVESLGLQDRILLLGQQKNVEEYLCKAKIFAFTSSSEGFPNVLGEAMSCGLPVVAYDCIAGPRDIIQDGNNGYLIPLFDKELFREKLCRLMNDENLIKEYGDNAQRSIRRYDAVTISEQYYNFITAKNEKTSCN